MVRKAREGDLQELLELYQYLHEKEVPGPSGPPGRLREKTAAIK